MLKFLKRLFCIPHRYEYELSGGVMECRRCGKVVEK